jgi:hypothetical protein
VIALAIRLTIRLKRVEELKEMGKLICNEKIHSFIEQNE